MLASGSTCKTRDQLLSYFDTESTHDLNRFVSEVAASTFANGRTLGGPELSPANGAWFDNSVSLKRSFKTCCRQILQRLCQSRQHPKSGVIFDQYGNLILYGRHSAGLMLQFVLRAELVRNKVNQWADVKTRGHIKDILGRGSVTSETLLILANALYFKGVWSQIFDTSKTRKGDFHLLDGSSVKVPFMRSPKDQDIFAQSDFKALRLDYHRGDETRQFSMDIFLPNAVDGMTSLVEKVMCDPESFCSGVDYQKVKVGDFRIPRVQISSQLEASDIMRRLRMESLFFPGGLMDMAESPEGKVLFAEGIIHKAFIEVNEQGTKAAAATALTCCSMSWNPTLIKRETSLRTILSSSADTSSVGSQLV